MSAEVVPDNPYSRLMALKRMGVVPDYERIREKCVAVVGVGGVGSVAAEMLTRCGVGQLVLFDYDNVELANMNRLFFRPDQAGLSKVSAAVATLSSINPDVDLVAHSFDVTSVHSFDAFVSHLSSTDLILCCVDNYAARNAVNAACNQLGKTWLESGVSEDAVSGHIQLITPGRLACFACAPPLVVARGQDERQELKRDGVCAASLPTTMGVVAGLLVQAALKWLLRFGSSSGFLAYAALSDFFPSMTLRPNPACEDEWCRRRQADAASENTERREEERVIDDDAEKKDEGDLHPDNEWGITVDNDGAEADSAPVQHSKQPAMELAEGLRFAYDERKLDGEAGDEERVEVSGGAEVDDLLAQLRSL